MTPPDKQGLGHENAQADPGDTRQLNARQEAFALAVAEGCSPLEAYKKAGYSTRATEKTQGEEASRLLRNPKISARIAEIRVPAVEAAGVTLEGHLSDLLAIRNKAMTDGKYSAAVQAETGRGKAAGLITAKHHHSGGSISEDYPVVRIVVHGREITTCENAMVDAAREGDMARVATLADVVVREAKHWKPGAS